MSDNDHNPIPAGSDDRPTLSDDTADEIGVAGAGEIDLDAELQSQLPLPVDTHSAPLDHPAPALPITAEEVLDAEEKTAQAAQPTPGPAPSTPTTPVAQAAQTVVVGAKQAAQQVTAAVQQSAQKITVAPRQAIYRGKRFLAIYGGLAGGAAIVALL